MTKHGDKLSHLTIEEVTERLNEESDGKAIKRLVAAREYLDGNSPSEISDKFGWPEQTIYSWLDRFESKEIDKALYDDSPPGRPGALTDEEFATFKRAVSNPPKEIRYDAPAWSSALAQEFLRDEFDQEFSRRHVRRLLKRAGLSWQTPRPQPPTADEEEREEFRKDLKKLTSKLPEKYTTITIDQTRKSVGCELYNAWFPEGERVSLPYWKTYEGVNLLGALSANGETFFTPVADSFTSDVTIRFLKALQAKFGEYVHVVLDNATYFTSNKVAEFVEDSSLKVTYLPTGSPDMNPVEECWRQFSRSLGNRFFDDLAELRSAVWPALKSISPPNIYDYLCPSV